MKYVEPILLGVVYAVSAFSEQNSVHLINASI